MMFYTGRVPQRAIMEHDMASSRGQVYAPAEGTGGPQHPDDGEADGTGQPPSFDGHRPARGQMTVTRAR